MTATSMDITQLILEAAFLSDKEKFMWIKITEKLNEAQLKKLADIFLDEANKRKILMNQLTQVDSINKQYLSELRMLNTKYGESTVRTNAKIGSTEAQRKMLHQLGDI